MVIRAVESGSPAEALHIQPGENLVSINGHVIRDLLDYHFHVADGDLSVVVESPSAGRRMLTASLDVGEDLGLVVDPIKTRLCGNECVFCFIDQNPKGMRETIYVKDEDYRLSFLHGNFVTLTNMKRWELERIVAQRLSPIYVSVHSTDPSVRRRLLRPRVDADVLEQIDFLVENDIVVHAQIVLCPGYNDGEDLDHTIRDLSARWPLVRSLAVVPVGLTEHRASLTELRPVTPEDARTLLDRIGSYQAGFHEVLGVEFIYAGDELYHLAGVEPPDADRYDGFPQIENGVGITRQFLDCMQRADATLMGPDRFVTLVTGEMFAPTLRGAVEDWRGRTGRDVRVEVLACANRFFGSTVTVAGLLTATDIAHALGGHDLGDRVLIPSETLNGDRLFLDGRTVEDLARTLGVPVQAGFDRS